METVSKHHTPKGIESKNTSKPSLLQETHSKAKTIRTTTHVARENTSATNVASYPLSRRPWIQAETISWWKEHYHQREKEGREQNHQEQEKEPEQKKKGEKKKEVEAIVQPRAPQASSSSTPSPSGFGHKLQVSGSENTIATKQSPTQPSMKREQKRSNKDKKPQLTPPRLGVFALYYILTKIGMLSDGASNFTYKNEIAEIDKEMTETHQKRLEAMREAVKNEDSARRWGISQQVFTWMGSLLGVITGAVLIATCAGAVAGAMLIAGGVISVTNQLLEVTGGWHKIANMLPDDDPEKKRAVISWMQIGISILCIVLGGVGAVWGGLANVGGALGKAQAFFTSIISFGFGITAIGEGLTLSVFYNKQSESKQYDLQLSTLKHLREDLMEKIEWGLDRLEQLFEDLVTALGFYNELFRAEQMINYR